MDVQSSDQLGRLRVNLNNPDLNEEVDSNLGNPGTRLGGD
jgi:hypothetical protein